jgi:hypothetical protein
MIILLPTDQCDLRSNSNDRLYVELVGQPARSAQTQPKTAARRKSVRHRLLQVSDSGSVVFEFKAHAHPAFIGDAFDPDGASSCMIYGVPRDFTCCGDDLGLVDETESNVSRANPDRLSNPNHILARPDL